MTSSPDLPPPVPHGATARRLEWRFLPSHVRALVEQRCGSPVLEADSQTGGFTPGFASVLTCADGTRHFVKAASVQAQKPFAESYREEIRKLRALPHDVPAPRLVWSHEEDWVVLETEFVDAVAPARPWRRDQLDLVLDALETVADRLTPPPASLALDPLPADLAPLAQRWGELPDLRADLPGMVEHRDEAAGLARLALEVTAGETVVHTDVRDDNVLLTDEGALLCDWNWPAAGAAWVDTLITMIGPRGDGHDVEPLLAERRLTRDVPAEHLDAMIALLVGYFLTSAEHPVPPTSPYLRVGQRWQGEVCWAWLAQRRGWR